MSSPFRPEPRRRANPMPDPSELTTLSDRDWRTLFLTADSETQRRRDEFDIFAARENRKPGTSLTRATGRQPFTPNRVRPTTRDRWVGLVAGIIIGASIGLCALGALGFAYLALETVGFWPVIVGVTVVSSVVFGWAGWKRPAPITRVNRKGIW